MEIRSSKQLIFSKKKNTEEEEEEEREKTLQKERGILKRYMSECNVPAKSTSLSESLHEERAT